MKRFAFYDFETTGTSPKYDQALQFAAILTDEDFNTLEEIDIRCRLSDYILPSPIALAVTGVTPDLLLSPDRTQYDFAVELNNIVERWSPAIWTGYNTIQFDENVLRQLFYQNLLPNLYLTSMNGSARLDILKVVYGCWGYGLEPPKIPELDGKLTSRLDTLAPHNGFNEHNAHDALGDVRATIFIARMIRDNHSNFWRQIFANLNKKALSSELKSGQVFDLVERFGGAPPRIYRGIFCGFSKTNANQFGFFDLDQIDKFPLGDISDDAIADAVEKSPKVIRTVDLNKVPILSVSQNVSVDHAAFAEEISAIAEFHDRVGTTLANRFADREASEFVEEQIYDGFYDPQHKALLSDFHKRPWTERAGIINQMSDPRLRELGERLLVQYAPETVSEKVRSEFWKLISERWSGTAFYGENERNPGNTYDSVKEDMALLKPGEKFEVPESDFEAYVEFFDNRKITV